MVPVVFGWAEYSLYAPAGSYINALDFDTVEDLARYLWYLHENDEEYLKYFSWRGKFKIENLNISQRLCILCQQMYESLNHKWEPSAVHERGRTKHPSVRKWHETLPKDLKNQRVPFYIGKHAVLNSTKACVRYDEHEVLDKWLKGE